MKLSFTDYKDKLMGCWMGKNIGGTLGEPFEGRRGVMNLDFYAQDMHGEPLPNDDLDLQLVWLNVVEKYANRVNASVLGEYWLMYITPHWSEYGIGANNLQRGLVPPLSGHVDNAYHDSNGCFIRSEIWACLAPGNPEIAARYAYEDAIVDHSHEGVYAEVFLAALESAAFVESDKFRLIKIGLSYIPDASETAKGIKLVLELHQAGKTWQEARREVMIHIPSDYGRPVNPAPGDEDFPRGKVGQHAPNNIALTIIGWLYGEDDFGKSICIAVNCGEDTDCTGASLGSILGIIHGMAGIPPRWIEPIGHGIKTISINLGDEGITIPKTIDELVERILRQAPLFLGSQICDVLNPENGYVITVKEGDALFQTTRHINRYMTRSFQDIIQLTPFAVRNDFALFSTILEYEGEPFIASSSQKKFRLTVENTVYHNQWISVKWFVPEGLRVLPENNISLPLQQYHGYMARVNLDFVIESGELKDSSYDLVLEISSLGHVTKGLIPVVLIHKPG
jgi:ADP-ribosylglycohydrolase